MTWAAEEKKRTMPEFLGIDTSNYTTSAAIFDSDIGKIYKAGKLLPVREGESGLRQSDAVFHHTKQLPEMIRSLYSGHEKVLPSAVAASVSPRNERGSYMPCFLCGEAVACSVASVCGIPFYPTSHQVGHIIAALYSSGKTELINRDFIAFHVSGGTTDCLLCSPDRDDIILTEILGRSLDLKAGQAVDRVGLKLGLKFPCGLELEQLAGKSTRKIKTKPTLKGNDCCLSGLENKCGEMLDSGEKPEDIAAYCIDFIGETVLSMVKSAFMSVGCMPVVFAGGVMSDRIIRKKILSEISDAYFASSDFSCDNAAGIALYAYYKMKRE